MTREAIKDQVVAIIADKLTIDKSKITEQSTLAELGADSLDLVEIIMRMEEKFDVEINDEQAEKLCNVGQVIDYIELLAK
ncbi:acyl carrier protein [Candidatus Dependentiae bacterium Noda2021]|nr:acyl carrier protein [Candidatus Dependentiae bacterium Noda2021]